MGTKCLAFGEGQGTPLVMTGKLAKRINAVIVNLESAFPGYGEFVVVENCDHVNICKPRSRRMKGYKMTLDFLRKRRDAFPRRGPPLPRRTAAKASPPREAAQRGM